jgi:hypothetical protein
MNSWLVWIVLAFVVLVLGVIGCHFSLRTLRCFAVFVALATLASLTVYGLTRAVGKNSSLSGKFARSADALSSALVVHRVPAPGRIGWLVILVLLLLGYRELEAWALRHQAPCLDVSELTGDRKDNAANAEAAARIGKLRHDWLVAELKFRLPAVEVRLPAILPGGSRPSGLASIAEATGVSGGGLAGAIIRFFGMVWPSPAKIQVRAWVEWAPGQVSIDGLTRVTVSLADQRTGAGIATKTLAAGSLDDAVAAVAGYVARHIFARDRTVPPWSASATDGADLAALLLARQVRGYPEWRSGIRGAWHKQIELLQGVAQRNLCAGVVRYELAQLFDLTGRHVEALLLHAANRDQYPSFYRGRYRLAMSLEMLANPDSGLCEIDTATLKEAMLILDRCCVTRNAADKVIPDRGRADVLDSLRPDLLAAARKELQEIQRYLTWRHILWGSLWHRNERAVLGQYWRWRHRQAFHDAVYVALLLVAVRQSLLEGTEPTERLGHAKTIARIAAAISGDSGDFSKVALPARKAKHQPVTARLRTRRWPWQSCTPSWPAAYNLACAYAALAADQGPETKMGPLVAKAIRSLEFALCNPECEMERPSEWIRNDPDFSWLGRAEDRRFTEFLHSQEKRDYPAGG